MNRDAFQTKSPIRFPLSINKESDYENYLSKKQHVYHQNRKSKRLYRKTNKYYIHYPISSTESSINSPATQTNQLYKNREKLKENNNPLTTTAANTSNNDTLQSASNWSTNNELSYLNSLTNQSESTVLLNSYKLV